MKKEEPYDNETMAQAHTCDAADCGAAAWRGAAAAGASRSGADDVVAACRAAIVARETITAGGNKRSGAHLWRGGLGGRPGGDARRSGGDAARCSGRLQPGRDEGGHHPRLRGWRSPRRPECDPRGSAGDAGACFRPFARAQRCERGAGDPGRQLQRYSSLGGRDTGAGV